MNVLVVNWQDREHPQAGGAEIHLFEIFGRLAARGHRVQAGLRRVAWGRAAGADRRHRGRARGHATDLRARRPPRGAAGAAGRAAGHRGRGHQQAAAVSRWYDRAAVLRDRPAPVRRDGLRGGALADGGGRSGRPSARLARAYRRAFFHAISESTRDDLVARGVAPERIRVIHPGVDAASVHARA